MVAQRQTDLDAKLQLIKRGVMAANEQNQLEADLRARRGGARDGQGGARARRRSARRSPASSATCR